MNFDSTFTRSATIVFHLATQSRKTEKTEQCVNLGKNQRDSRVLRRYKAMRNQECFIERTCFERAAMNARMEIGSKAKPHKTFYAMNAGSNQNVLAKQSQNSGISQRNQSKTKVCNRISIATARSLLRSRIDSMSKAIAATRSNASIVENYLARLFLNNYIRTEFIRFGPEFGNSNMISEFAKRTQAP